jgi:hypothetical protein
LFLIVATVGINKCFVFKILCRYALQLHRENEAEIRELKEAARKSTNPMSASGLEMAIEDFFLRELDFPK